MSATDTATETAAGSAPRLRDDVRVRWSRWRGAIVLVAAMVALAVVIGLAQSQQRRGYLDPAGVDAGGSRALATLLEDQGVEVTDARSLDDAVAASGPETTVLVTIPDLLLEDQISRLVDTGADLVLVAPTISTELYRPGLTISGDNLDDVIDPRCDFAPAERAGAARMGGIGYAERDGATACYPATDGATLVVDTTERGARLVVTGTAAFLTNEHLDQDGNAALAMNVLGANAELTWYRPVPEAAQGTASLTELLPPWVAPVALQLGVAALFAALWRARRMGRLVAEPLPVVVKSAETTQGRARLYRRGRSRAHAASILRDAARRRLRARLGLPPGDDADAALAEAVAARTSRSSSAVTTILAGPDPADDAELVRLADTLDALEKEVRT